jgi:hypothetical protein
MVAAGDDAVECALAVGADVDQVRFGAHPSERLGGGESAQSRAGGVE